MHSSSAVMHGSMRPSARLTWPSRKQRLGVAFFRLGLEVDFEQPGGIRVAVAEIEAVGAVPKIVRDSWRWRSGAAASSSNATPASRSRRKPLRRSSLLPLAFVGGLAELAFAPFAERLAAELELLRLR